MDSRDEEKILRDEIMKELLSIALDDQNPEKQVKVGLRLNPQDADELTKALRRNVNIFAWSIVNMPGISLEVITHQLNVSPNYHPVRQKRRHLA